MENIVPNIRNAVRAVIVRQGQVLMQKKEGGYLGERYTLPGGAQDLGETLGQALNRECIEEIGTPVEIISLLTVADFFKNRETDPPSTRHLVEFLFHCTVPDDYVAHNGNHPDKSQVDVVWVDLNELSAMPLFPKSLSHWLPNCLQGEAATYMGLLE